MSKIHLLPEDLVNKIAAGEVVERPASVVKELVENSIDAGATRIVVEIEDGGKKLIRIADNGCGMSEKEIELALQRHSTSKIQSVDDLFNIHTLGFRGEALPSIASISCLTIKRNPTAGLTIEVRDLFHNTPVRRKFLKSNATEIGRCGDIIAKYILAYPGISFKFLSDGKILLASHGTGKLPEAVAAVYGATIAKELLPVEHEFGGGKISGLVSRPTVSRIDKNYENFFVNARYVRNFLLNRSLEDAFRTYIPTGRYPISILMVEIDPVQVDVNVHPTKIEVKFMKNQEVMDAVRSAVKKALELVAPTPTGEAANYPQHIAEWEPQMSAAFFSSEDAAPILAEPTEISAKQPLIPLYQLQRSYIVATDGRSLSVIDQHAAHERIIYDRLSRTERAIDRQTMLIPETLEFELPLAVALKANLVDLQKLGFEIEEFGQNSFIVRAVPALAGKVPATTLLSDIASDLRTLGQSEQLAIRQENLHKSLACHSAIKAGEPLTSQEMAALIRDLFLTENPTTCPHGRPLIFTIQEAEIMKKFHRPEKQGFSK
ncbi:MAG: DNA mismatch repair endonuclease MutL [Candidatus Margulisiibacteriota bacterium]|jgi:DNA mismatch repair protein MutL